jgi:hypothetical protein
MTSVLYQARCTCLLLLFAVVTYAQSTKAMSPIAPELNPV